MAKSLTFSLGALQFQLSPRKVDRDHLYGHTELRAVTDSGAICLQGAINGDGTNIICPGATKIGLADGDGRWVDRAELVPATVDGIMPVRVASSFDAEIVLDREASVEDLLNLTINTIYHLTGDEEAVLQGLVGDRIYAFPFSYRGGYERQQAYLLTNDHGVFMLAGTHADYEFLALEEVGELDNPDEELALEEDILDFSML